MIYCQRGEIQWFCLNNIVVFEIIVGELVVKSPYNCLILLIPDACQLYTSVSQRPVGYTVHRQSARSGNRFADLQFECPPPIHVRV